MKLNVLLMCRNQPALRILANAFNGIGVGPEVCLSAPDTMEWLVKGHYSALVLDFDLPGASQVARMVRIISPDRRPVIFTMIGAMTPVGGAFQAGANFVLYKPLAAEQVSRSLRAARGFLNSDRRRSPRHALQGLVHLQFSVGEIPAIMVDLSEQGLALQAPERLPKAQEVPLRFVLPGTAHGVEGTGQIIWSNDEGRAGMFFSRLTLASRKYLKDWLNQRGAKKKDAVRVLLEPEKVRQLRRASH
jgi:ActR/RegA family two-component response regulator